MTKVVLIQIIIYLFIMPLSLFNLDVVKNYRFDLSLVFLIFFLAGAFSVRKNLNTKSILNNKQYIPKVTLTLKLMLILLSICYIFVIISNDLLVRRQGSDVIAIIYANLNSIDLLIIRVFEIIFYPILLLTFYNFRRDKTTSSKVLLLSLVVAFFFTGIIDSRAKLLIPILTYYVFFIAPGRIYQPIKPIIFKITALILILLACLIGFSRINDFIDLGKYLQNDILSRLDGLELISLVHEQSNIPFWGSFDFLIFTNFIASIPFFEEAKALKAVGLTSSKNYLLQVILGRSQMDMNNSLLTDLFYFGGYPLLVLGSGIYGYCSAKLDFFILSETLFSSRLKTSFMMSFFINSLRLEQDYFGILISIFRDFLILYFIFLGIKFVRNRNSPKQNMIVSANKPGDH